MTDILAQLLSAFQILVDFEFWRQNHKGSALVAEEAQRPREGTGELTEACSISSNKFLGAEVKGLST